jgi:hypothetical protein
LNRKKAKKLKRKMVKLSDKESIEAAILNVNVKGTNVSKAARLTGIPRSKLNNHLNGKVKSFVRGRPPVFSLDEETALVKLLTDLGACGFGLERVELLSVASKYAKNLGKESRFKNGIPGADWVIFYFIIHCFFC